MSGNGKALWIKALYKSILAFTIYNLVYPLSYCRPHLVFSLNKRPPTPTFSLMTCVPSHCKLLWINQSFSSLTDYISSVWEKDLRRSAFQHKPAPFLSQDEDEWQHYRKDKVETGRIGHTHGACDTTVVVWSCCPGQRCTLSTRGLRVPRPADVGGVAVL